MKKALTLAAVSMLSLSSSAFATAKPALRIETNTSVDSPKVVTPKTGILTIDSVKVAEKYDRFKDLLGEMNKERDLAMQTLRDLETDLSDSRQKLEKQTALLSKESRIEKQKEIADKEKAFVRKRDALAQDFEDTYQLKQAMVFQEVMEEAQEVLKAEDAAILIDKRAQGVIAVNDSTDVSDIVSASLNTKYRAKTAEVKTA